MRVRERNIGRSLWSGLRRKETSDRVYGLACAEKKHQTEFMVRSLGL